MEQSLGQKIAMIDKLHQFNQKLQANLSCGNQTEDCKLGLFQDSSCASNWRDSKSTSGGLLCVLGSHTFDPISWMCKKQSAVSHSSAESEIFSLDAGFRVDGFSTLEVRVGNVIQYQPWETLSVTSAKESFGHSV